MSNSPQPVLDRAVSSREAALLRHDMVLPINLIVGYCELILGDEALQGDAEIGEAIRSIRQLGFALLRSIDDVLLVDRPQRSAADIVQLAHCLERPAIQVIEACAVATERSGRHHLPEEFALDLARISGAGQDMLEMATRLGRGESLMAG